MNYCDLPNYNSTGMVDERRRFDRLSRTATLQGEAFERWTSSAVGVFGAGVLGSRLAIELVRSGINCCVVFDFDKVSEENLGNQAFTTQGVLKADALRDACDAIRPGIAESRPIDLCHVGVGELSKLDAIVDATDDPKLESIITELSNGLQIPMLRIAVDGSGEKELGRVQVSHGG
ncbi:MAG TPA: ThiF family adenylyltransferase, partial [Thermoguttaceae bacterium]